MTNLISDDLFINETVKDFLKNFRKEALLPTCSTDHSDPNSEISRFPIDFTAVDRLTGRLLPVNGKRVVSFRPTLRKKYELIRIFGK